MKQTIAEQVANGKKRRRNLSILLCIPLGLAFYVCKYVLPGYSFLALVCLCLIGVILFYSLMPLVGLVLPRTARLLTRIVSIVIVLGLLVCGATEAVIISASFGTPEKSCDYMVVLGAKVRPDGPSVSLQDRINAAYDYLTAHPDVIAVVSGGQGSDEHMSEAECMYLSLTAMGIPEDRVWIEDHASSTWENIQFSLDVIEDRTGVRPTTLGVLSSEYHLFRASLFVKACNVDFVGIPAKTSRPGQVLNHFLREIAGVWHYIILGGSY